MQAQTHVPNAVPGQVSRMAQQNGSSLPVHSTSTGSSPRCKTWQADADVALRHTVVESIFLLFQKRRGPVTQEWQQRLPDFVKRLEEALYRSATTKEEYADPQTLEVRLQLATKRMTRAHQSAHQHGAQAVSSFVGNLMPAPGSTMIPTPGTMTSTPDNLGTPGTVSNVIATQGTLSSMTSPPGHGNNVLPTTLSSSGNTNSMMRGSGPGVNSMFNNGSKIIATPGAVVNGAVSQQGMGGIRVSKNGNVGLSVGVQTGGSQMIPTPGLATSQAVGLNDGSSAGLVLSNVTATPVQQQAPFGGHMYRNLNGQICGNINNIPQQRKNSLTSVIGMSNGMQVMGNNQHLMNENATMLHQGSYSNPNQLSGMQVQSQQQQRQQQIRMQTTMSSPMVSASDSYAMNAADLAGSGMSYPPVSSGLLTSSSLGMSTNGSQSQKMIPVPGLPSTLQNPSHLQQANRSQLLDRSNFSQSSALARTQLQQHILIPKSQGIYPSLESCNLLAPSLPAGSTLQDQLQQMSPPQKMPLPVGCSLFDSQPESPLWQHQPPVSLQHHQVSMQLQQHEGTVPQLNNHKTQGQQQSSQVEQKLPDHQRHQQTSFTSHLQTVKSTPQQSALQQVRPPEQVQHRSFVESQQLQRQMLLAPQMQQDLEHKLQQQSISSLNSCQQQQSHLHTLSTGSALLMQSTPHSCVPNGRLPGGQLPAGAIDPQRAQQYSKQQRWLLFLRHASKCTASEGHCNISPHCHMARQLWTHLSACREQDCQYTRCNASRTLLQHYRQCSDGRCPVCGPVKHMITQKRPQASPISFGQMPPVAMSTVGFSITTAKNLSPSAPDSGLASTVSALDVELQPPHAKRVKAEPENVVGMPGLESSQLQGAFKVQTSTQVAVQQQTSLRLLMAAKSELQIPTKTDGAGPGLSTVPKIELLRSHHQSTMVPQRQMQLKIEVTQGAVESALSRGQSLIAVKSEQGTGRMDTSPSMRLESVHSLIASTTPNAKSGKPKIVGTSLTELFTPEMIREHITGLRQWVGQSKAKAEKNQAMEHQMSDNACRLCAVEKLTFEPPPIYCSACGARIKRNALYYTVGSGEARHFFCIPCYSDIRTDSVDMDGMTYLKSRLEKRKNDEETEEAWVQCDKCNQWNHQVCALFNGRRNEGGEAEYTCPQCCMSEIESGERKPLLSSAVLGAKDLPKTLLSDHLEQRLARKLKQERTDRARVLGKSIDEIVGADSLVIRVVSSVDKKLEVKHRFMEIFQEEDYPTEFPYKSKVVLLFQKIEGVEVCLFGMYVQEFGVECQHPNQRRVYLSYLDSVKYFRPDVKTVNGEALRTYVYHEILIAYLDYCKRRGFSSCYIWACPPLKGEDYILYCHPEIQKTPKSDKLRDWYLAMLKKATADGIVVEVTNLYDYFFVSTGDCKAKVTAARLPYFDGDYWPGAAEDMIVQLQQEEEDGQKLQKKGKNKKTATKRASKASVQAELASNASKDVQLMYKLGESILPMKEDFIMVHMHHACSHCRMFIIAGYRWNCKQCKNIQLCDRCHDADRKLDERDRHPISSKDAHAFTPVLVEEVPQETKDKDDFMESEFFDTRQAFLSLCQGNHYQYDTLRRAKHSSMMVLYHLHNPTAPAFVITCNMCHRDIETGSGWRCETCPDFDLCNSCKDSAKHLHKLTPHPSPSERNEQNKEARQQRVLQLRKMLELLVHASQCGVPHCSYPKCRSVKGLFRHGMMCKTRASGGCALCKRMWYLLQLHARACKESDCRVPRCKDLKEHLRRSIQQQESRRRAAVMEMMRQRAAEAAGGSN